MSVGRRRRIGLFVAGAASSALLSFGAVTEPPAAAQPTTSTPSTTTTTSAPTTTTTTSRPTTTTTRAPTTTTTAPTTTTTTPRTTSTTTSSTTTTTIATKATSSSTPWGWIILAIALAVAILLVLLLLSLTRRRGRVEEWQRSVQPAVTSTELARGLVLSQKETDDAQHRASVGAQVDDAVEGLERGAASAPDDAKRGLCQRCADSLRGLAFAVEADHLLRSGGQQPTGQQLAEADQARRRRSAELDAALADLKAAITPHKGRRA